MKLQEFVSETLREIIAGVKEAQAYATSTGATVNPRMPPVTEAFSKPLPIATRRADGAVPIEDTDFDVAVTSTDTTETQAGAGVFISVLAIGARDKSDTSNSCVSRIRFSVPIALPVQGEK